MKIFFLFIAMSPLMLWGQKIKTLRGEYTYYLESTMTEKEATALAVENARLQAIANEFGTFLTQNTQQQDVVSNDHESTFFMQLNAMEVRGEWIRDIDEPEITKEIMSDGTIAFKAKVKIEARAISNETTDIDVKVLRNGTEKKFADTNFKNGDDLYLYLKAPVDGYVAIYLIDETPTAYCLLPYSGDNDGQHPIQRNKENIFFSPALAEESERHIVDELTMTCGDNPLELNQLYVIFSPNPFTKAVDNEGGELIPNQLTLPRQLDYKDFSRWLSKQRSRDPKMGLQIVKLKIQN